MTSKFRLIRNSVLAASLASFVGLGLMAAPSFAQGTTLRPFPLGGKKRSTRPVKISVSYQFFLEGDTRTMAGQTELADQGRKHLYKLLAKECDVLLDTIASTCAIERANVNSQLRNSGRLNRGVRISGSATYRVDLKPTGDDKDDDKKE